MIFPFEVKKNGVYYPAGTEVPTGSKKGVAKPLSSQPGKVDTKPEIQKESAVKESVKENERKYSEEELNTPGAIRMLLSKIDDYDNCQKELQEYKNKFHQCDKQCAVLTTAAKANTAFDILYSFLLAVGSALIGIAPSIQVDNTQNYIPWVLGIVGIIALGGGILAKIFKS